MGRALVLGTSLWIAGRLACAPVRPPAIDPSGLADPAWKEPDEGAVAPVAANATPAAIAAVIPGDVVCPEEAPPKEGMGPPFFRAPRRTGCGGPRTSLMVYPIRFDRRAESDRP